MFRPPSVLSRGVVLLAFGFLIVPGLSTGPILPGPAPESSPSIANEPTSSSAASAPPTHGFAPPSLRSEDGRALVPSAEESPRPAAVINPLAGYSSEPAPMGIADFGVTGKGSGAHGYWYNTPVFQGTADVRSINLAISGSSSKVAAFELNAMLLLQRN